ncbi:5858_t:CDS:1, partial [Racocetra persica]
MDDSESNVGHLKTFVQINHDNIILPGELYRTNQDVGICIFVHGSGSSRLSP